LFLSDEIFLGMYKKKCLWSLAGFLYFLGMSLWAQTSEDSLSTQILTSVTVESSPLEKYLSGTKRTHLDSQILRQSDGTTLNAILMQNSPVYLKEYGNGMLASVSFRGTGSSHTAVLWNGITINSLTAGNPDFTLLPIFMFDNIDIQHGSASSLYGSDALGGAIYLSSTTRFWDNFQLAFQQHFGSFGTYFSGLKTTYGNGKFAGQTKIYHFRSENNFPFRNTSKIGYPTEHQTNADFQNYGISQSLNYRFNAKKIFTSEIWYHVSDRNLAHSMSRIDSENGETQKDESLRFSAQFIQHFQRGTLSLKSGFVSDYLLYNNLSEIATNRLVFSIEYETEFSDKMTLLLGGNYRKITADVDNYNGRINENRGDIFALFRYDILKNWTLSFNARQAFVTGFFAPFAPSIGSDFRLSHSNNHQLFFKLLASRSYRIPTLNDRYWEPGGNPDILSEDGISTDIGFAYKFRRNKIQFDAELTHFRMQVKNWILWRPVGQFWSPMNLGKVQAQGLELVLNLKHTFTDWSWKIHGNYSLTQSLNKKKLHEYDQSVNKQLIYTPLHRGTAYGKVQYKMWNTGLNFQYTSKRFTLSDNSEFLEGFGLWDWSLSKEMKLKKHQFLATLQIKNLMNINYQNLPNYAMPRRNFMLQLRYHFQ